MLLFWMMMSIHDLRECLPMSVRVKVLIGDFGNKKMVDTKSRRSFFEGVNYIIPENSS